MSSLYKNTIIYASLVMLASLLICHFTFSYYGRLESDDYNLIAYLRDKGFFGTISFIYMEWEGAFGVLLVSLLKIKFTVLINSLFIHNIVSTIITLYSVFYFIRTILLRYFSVHEKNYALILSILIYSDLYYNDLAINDTWYWLCGSIYFFMPCLLLFFTAILINNNNKYLNTLAYFYFFIYGASRFNYSVILLSILGLILLYYWCKNKIVHKKIVLLFLLVLLALIIYVIAPGNYVRRNEELKHVLTLSDYAIGPLKMWFGFIYKYLILKLPFHMLFMIPAFLIGHYLKESIHKLYPDRKQVLQIIILIVLFCTFCIYMQSLSMFVAKGSQRDRTLEMLSMICSFGMLAVFMLIGSRVKSRNFIFIISIICILGSSIFLLRRVYISYPIIKKYAVAVDERHRTIKNALKGLVGDTLVLKKLPPFSWLHSGEFENRKGSNPMNNIFLENYYQHKIILDVEK